MGSQDRRARILQRVQETGVVRARELAESFQVSEMTVRRDLDQLAADHLVLRMRGGAARIRQPTDDGLPSAGNASIGIVFPNIDHLYPSVAAAIEGALKDSSVTTSLLFSNYNLSLERRLVDELIADGVDGLLYAPTVDEEQPDLDHLEWLTNLAVPMVLVERRLPQHWPVRSIPSVRFSFRAGLAVAIRHLTSLGHRRVAFFGHVARMDLDRLRRQWQELVDGHGLDAAGSPYLVDRDFKNWQSSAEPERVLAQVREAGATALICRHDPVALTMVHHARQTGLRIPKDLSVVAYDDDVASLCDPPLTAISPPKAELGRQSSRMIIEMIRHRRGPGAAPTLHLELEPSLVVRSSTGPPRTT